MNKNALGLILSGILIGSIVGVLGVKTFIFDPEIHEYQSTIRYIENTNRDLETQKNNLEKDLQEKEDTLQEKEIELQEIEQSFLLISNQYNQLFIDYMDLNEELDETLQEFDTFMIYYEQTSEDINDLSELLNSYTFVKDSISRVLNDQTVQQTSDTVLSIIQDKKSFWNSYKNIYNYVISHIEYKRDTEYPYLRCDIFPYNDKELITGVEVFTSRNYVQTPDFTLTYKQGDCEDQAVLLYAMMKYYLNYMYNQDYTLYLMQITLVNKVPHLAVLQPVQVNNICILDPAGHYLTSISNQIATNEANKELIKYSEYWGDTEYGEIIKVTLYEVYIETGEYITAFDGTLNQAINFLSN